MPTRALRCQWTEPVPRSELTHQLEPGEPLPLRTRNGVIIDYAVATEQVRADAALEAKAIAFVLDEETYQLLIRPISSVRLIRPSKPTTYHLGQPVAGAKGWVDPL